LVEILKNCIDLTGENAIFAPEEWLGEVQKIFKTFFKLKKHIICSQSILEDVIDPQRQFDIIKTEHERAHRGIQENYAQIKNTFSGRRSYTIQRTL
jgi:hypothetical protein